MKGTIEKTVFFNTTEIELFIIMSVFDLHNCGVTLTRVILQNDFSQKMSINACKARHIIHYFYPDSSPISSGIKHIIGKLFFP